MALTQDFNLHVSLHMQSLDSLQGGVPSGLHTQLSEVSSILAQYDSEVGKIERDLHLSEDGKAARVKTAYDAARTAIDKWRIGKTAGIDAQTASQQAKLQAQTDKLLAAPTDIQVRNMVQRLSSFDPLEVEVLYASATDADRRVIEVAADAVGRQPHKRGEQLVWEPLIATERVAAVRAARVERANPEGAAAIRDSQRIRSTYEALAGAAKGLLRESLPSRLGSDAADAPVA
ncbi:MAG TPA: hypothetical protein VNJ02_18490 [Vicinamibacterales bacterium]|nr:hypothetical protein [Vicinamibacterales bacterium]